MHVILGGTGKVGAATACALLMRGEAVTVVTRDAAHAAELARAGPASLSSRSALPRDRASR